DPRGREGAAPLRVGEPRRTRLRRAGPLRRRAQSERPRRLRRLRRALLPGREPRAARAAHHVRGAARRAARARARRRRSAALAPVELHRRHRAHGDAVANLTGKVAFVTAGATGIGFACAQAIADAGGKVMICARREDTLEDAAAKLGPNAAWVACDVTD